MRWAMAIGDFMIQKGLARQWWAFRTRLIAPVFRLLGTRAPIYVTTFLVLVSLLVIVIMPGVSDFEANPRRGGTSNSIGPQLPNSPQEWKPVSESRKIDAPVEVAPVSNGRSVYIVSRDGVLRSMPVSGLGCQVRSK